MVGEEWGLGRVISAFQFALLYSYKATITLKHRMQERNEPNAPQQSKHKVLEGSGALINVLMTLIFFCAFFPRSFH